MHFKNGLIIEIKQIKITYEISIENEQSRGSLENTTRKMRDAK